MLAKKYRLPLSSFQSNYPLVTGTPIFTLKARKNLANYNRFGIIISNRAVKKSTQRHYLKRRLLNFLSQWPQLSLDFLLVVSPQIKKYSMGQIKEALTLVLNKLIK